MLYKSSTIVLFSFAACLFAARCGGGESGAVGGKDPLGENTTTTVHNYKVATNDGGTEYYSSSWTGENKVVNGVSYPVGIMEDPSTAEKDGIEVWANLTEESVEFAGGKVYWNSGGVAPPGEPFVSGALDQPVVIALSPTVGEPQELKVKGSAVMGDPSDPSNPHAIDTTVTFTLVDDQASVETEIGTVHDCKYFKASATVLGINLNADVRYNKQMGIVNANVNWPPPNGIKLDLTSLTDAGGAKEGYNVVKAVSVLGPP
ncbi:MAG: hypothetical protein FJ088_11740, partial [Deltaproteobacteria bacterium]|nr:hypothetical protein [Deltaproteobacteria bacterium]